MLLIKNKRPSGDTLDYPLVPLQSADTEVTHSVIDSELPNPNQDQLLEVPSKGN